MKDPLNNNTAKVKLFKAYCHNMTIELVNAGTYIHLGLLIIGIKNICRTFFMRMQEFHSFMLHNIISIFFSLSGHCPHDEIPEEINKLITMWLKQPLSQDAQSSLLQAAAQDMKS